MDNKILLEKDGVKFIKKSDNTFNISFSLENNLDVRPLINLNLIKLLHDLNPDLFEAYSAVDISANERHICILFKDLFADLGIPQYYYSFAFIINQESTAENTMNNTINFIISLKNDENNAITDATCAPLTHCEIACTIINNTIGQFNITAQVSNDELFNSLIFEKMVAMVLYKVINRLKQFISTIT